jgi:Zn finger protein HypA/HybF involved in hydrogenase expression
VHEVSLVQALFDQADQAIVPHPARFVRQLTVRIGTLAGVEAELFRTAFEGCKAERGYSAAVLEIIEESAAWRCVACGAAVALGGPLRCGSCPGQARLSAGGDLILQRVELEVRDV